MILRLNPKHRALMPILDCFDGAAQVPLGRVDLNLVFAFRSPHMNGKRSFDYVIA